jgi:hypothetical protein
MSNIEITSPRDKSISSAQGWRDRHRLVYNPPMIQSLTVLWRNRWPAVQGVAWGAALVTTAALPMVVFLAVTPTAKERQACDQAVATVLTTKEPLELERAMFLVQQLRGCRIRNQL